MRLTRSALRAEATPIPPLETPDASSVPLPPSPIKERVPLGEVSGNLINEEPEVMAPAKKTKAKGGRKAAKGKKGKKAEEAEPAVEEQVQVLEDERKAAASPASDAAVDELAKDAPGGEYLQVSIDKNQQLIYVGLQLLYKCQ